MSYDLVEQEEPQEPKKSTTQPLQPMPRLWKSEADPTEEDPPAAKKSRNEAEADSSRKSRDSRQSVTKGKTKSTKGNGPPSSEEKGDKKVLLEETPTLDTYESRRRARMIIGALVCACVCLFGWTIYRAFLYDPVGIVATDSAVDPSVLLAGAESRAALDQEAAHFMFNRAHELAKNGQTDQAMAMLNKVIKVYKGTPSARECKAAIDRAEKNLPLFSDSPLVVAKQESPKAAAPAGPPPAVVNAVPGPRQAGQGQAALILPANPGEVMVMPPGSAAKTKTSRGPVAAYRSLPQGFQANPDAGVHESGWPLVIVGDRDGAPMMLIPGGTFPMGNNDGQPAEGPSHQVRLSSYYIDQHEVTNRQFRKFLGESHYRGRPPGKWLSDAKARQEPDGLPVVQVSFDDAESFAAWAGKQIPTESQWEMAARSTDGRNYPWGDEPPKWSRPRAFRQIDPVMTFPEDKSPYGIFDMAGNAQEWTRDIFDRKYYRFLAKTITENPIGPPPHGRTPQHVVRGAAKNWSVTYREGLPNPVRLPYLGFRCVLVVGAQGSSSPLSQPIARPQGTPAGQQSSPPPF